MHSQRAFTLIEAIITLFIIAILMAITFPSLNSFIERSQDEIIQSQLLHAIELARLQSRIKHVPVSLCKSKDLLHCGGAWQDGWLIFLDPDEQGIIHSKKQLLSVIQTPTRLGKLYWRSFPVYRHYLLFLPDINKHGDNGTFWYCHAAAHFPAWAIVLNQFGRARVVYPDRHGEIKDNHGKALVCG